MRPNVKVLDHPLIKHKLTILRKKQTGNRAFRETLNELSYLLVYETTHDLHIRQIPIDTPLQPHQGHEITEQVLLVPVLRAGLGMVEGILRLIPSAKVGHIGLYRNDQTLQPVEYYFKMPPDFETMRTYVLDPMLATGGSLAYSIEMLKKRGCQNITVISILAAPEGLKKMEEECPEIKIYTAVVDTQLNENGYILPGLGDCGDRIFGTQ